MAGMTTTVAGAGVVALTGATTSAEAAGGSSLGAATAATGACTGAVELGALIVPSPVLEEMGVEVGSAVSESVLAGWAGAGPGCWVVAGAGVLGGSGGVELDGAAAGTAGVAAEPEEAGAPPAGVPFPFVLAGPAGPVVPVAAGAPGLGAESLSA
jgi:hypothetical protein